MEAGYNHTPQLPRKFTMRRKTLSQHIVVDPEICHGQPTFVGTRVRVAQVLEQVAEGMDWDTIVRQWRGTVPREAIAEAIQLAGEAFEQRTHTSPGKSRSL
jgi:uncharacterized protein (DUF433 family)